MSGRTFASLDEHTRAIFEARARLFARPLDVAEREPFFDAVAFELGRERFALDAQYVQRISHLGPVTRLPGIPRYFAGLANVRGHLLPIVDLAALLDVEAASETPYVIQLGRREVDIGIAASAVTEIRAIARNQASRHASGEQTEIVGRVLADGCTLLDGAALLDDRRLVAAESPANRFAAKEVGS